MYTPTLDVTHKMVHHIVETEHAVREIKDTPLTATAKEKLLDRMNGENLHNISKLIKAEATFKQSEKIAKGQALVSQGSPEMILANFRSATDFIYSSSNDRYISLSPSLLTHLNKILTNNVFDSWDSGRFRNLSDEVKTKYDQWFIGNKNDLRDIDLQQHFYEVLNWFSENRFYIHPLIKIGCVIYELFHIYPFVSGNQITILAVVEMLFEKSKLSLSGLLPIARNFVLYEDEYLEAMQVCKERGDDQTLWIERFVRGISLDISSLKNEAIRIEEEKIKKKKKKLLDLNSRQLKVINHLKHNPKIKRKEYVKMMGVSTMTAYRDINELVDRGILECKGGGRSTHYVLNEQNEDNQENEVRKNKVVKVISDPSFDQGPTSSQTQNQTQAQTQTQTQSQAQQSQYPNQYSNDSNSFGDNTSGTPVDSTNNTFASNREDTDYVGNVSGNNYSDEESEDNNPPSGYDNPSQFDDDLDGNVTQGDDDFSGFVNS